ncbi:hypothetical protein MTO96_033314 [Rhipicephalus appendiculatus]
MSQDDGVVKEGGRERKMMQNLRRRKTMVSIPQFLKLGRWCDGGGDEDEDGAVPDGEDHDEEGDEAEEDKEKRMVHASWT